MSAEKKSRTIHCLPPCPSYDVEGTESWLSHMAEEGFHLTRDGFFAGLATFEEGKPEKVRYRLEAAPKSTGILSDNGGEPDPQAVELCRELGWEYVAVRGEFYVYRSSLPGARELNTDPAVQAMVLREVRRRRRAAFFNTLFWFVLYPLLTFATGPLLTMIQMGTWFILLGVFLFLWVLRDSLRELLWLRKLEKKLLAGQPLDHRSGSWKRRTRRHPILSLLQLLLLVLWVGALLWDWGVSASNTNRVPLEEYQGNPPFATLADLAGEGELFRNMSGMGFNTVLEWEDWLAPYNADWSEHGQITRPDGTEASGSLFLDYHQTTAPWIARELAQEYLREDWREDRFALLDCPVPGSDLAFVYRDGYGYTTAVIQTGNRVVHAEFRCDGVPLEEWTAILAERISEG